VQDLGLEGVFADGTTAAALNSNALQAALAAVRPAMADRYRKTGWQLNFATDMLVSDNNAEKFIREGAMQFSPQQQDASSASSGRGVVQVTSPVLTSKSVGEIRKMAAAGKPDDPATAAMLAAADDPYMVRFLGNWYTKVRSWKLGRCWAAIGASLDRVELPSLGTCGCQLLARSLGSSTADTCTHWRWQSMEPGLCQDI
jgi:hypothetical protein